MPAKLVGRSRHNTRSLPVALLMGALCGCVGMIGPGDIEDDRKANAASAQVGTVMLGLQLAGGTELDQVTYVVSLDATAVQTGSLTLSDADAAFRAVFVLEEASGYLLTLSAIPESGPMCFGSAIFDVMRGSTTPVTVALTCPNASGSAGGADVTGFVNQCPTVASLIGSRASAPVGETITLDGVGEDPDSLPYPLAYMWSTTSGTVVTPAAATTEVVCVAPGPTTVTFRIFDGDAACAGTTASIDLSCTEPAADEDAGL